jgi:calcineurin-binding protein cabin-1
LKNGKIIPTGSIGDIQDFCCWQSCAMLQITSLKNLLSQLIADEMEEKQSCSFVYAGIAFCKLQHLVLTSPVKNQAVFFNEK